MADPITFLLPMLASIVQGAIGHGMSANQAANERNESIRMARARREELQPIIDKLREAGDFFNLEEQMARDLGRASSQIDANAAATGMTNAGAGGADNVRADLLGSMIASMAQVKQQDELARTQMLAEILSDPSLQIAGLQEGNVVGQSILGALLGGVSGAGTQFASYLSSEEGIKLLQGMGGNQTVSAEMGPSALGGDFLDRMLVNSAGVPERRQLSAPNASARILPPTIGYADHVGLAASPRYAPGQRGSGGLPNYYAANPIRPALW